jgi:putative transposase
MKKRYTEEQIIRILDEARDGQFIKEVCRKHNLSEATFYRWRKKYGDLDISELKRLKALEAENVRLKRIVANQAIDIDALKDVLAKKW